MLTIFSLSTCILSFSFAEDFEAKIKDYETFADNFAKEKADGVEGANGNNLYQQQLKPQESDREFVDKNKEKYKFLSKDEILDASKEKLGQEISKGNVDDPNAIHHKDLNQAATNKSMRGDRWSQDKSKTTPKEYLSIASKTDKDRRVYKKDLEEKQIMDALNVIKDPAKEFKKQGINPDCTEEDIDVQASLKPKVEKYKVNEKITKTEEEEKICQESEPVPFECPRQLKLTCNRIKECDAGGIVKGSVASDMKFEYHYPVLTIGTISDNYWCGHCQTIDKKTTFKIRNLAKIKEFKITQVGFDDHLWIKINDSTVYVGPSGGDKIELTQIKWIFGTYTLVSYGSGTNSCELGTNWNVDTNIDLKPYLKEGDNDIWMRVIVSGCGEGWMKIHARQDCCDNWLETWENKCEKDLKEFG